jgi:hypothetical protein
MALVRVGCGLAAPRGSRNLATAATLYFPCDQTSRAAKAPIKPAKP